MNRAMPPLTDQAPARRPQPLRSEPVAREQDEHNEEESWLLSYVDLFTLLLVMFVVMLTFSSPILETPPEPAADSGATGQAAERSVLLEQFEQQLAGLVQKGQLAISASASGISLQLEEEILFGSGTAVLLDEGDAVLSELAPALLHSGQAITVEGHSDNRPIATERFPSNWELSGARAAQVVRHLIEQGVPAARLRAVGYADTRPVAGNDTPEGRARNRRVTLLVQPLE